MKNKDLMEQTLKKYVGEILICRDRFNHAWSAKLIRVKNRICFFEVSDGRVLSNNLDDIIMVRPLNKFKKSEVV